MSILGLLVVIAILGVAAWVVSQIAIISEPFKKIIYVVLVVVACLIVFKAFFGVDPLAELQRPVR
jgi:small-conductance mechanosensitive channel